MNFNDDYKGFIEHIKNNAGSSGLVKLTREEDVAVRFFVAYLNLRYVDMVTRIGKYAEHPFPIRQPDCWCHLTGKSTAAVVCCPFHG